MKKTLALVLLLLICVFFVACGREASAPPEVYDEEPPTAEEPIPEYPVEEKPPVEGNDEEKSLIDGEYKSNIEDKESILNISGMSFSMMLYSEIFAEVDTYLDENMAIALGRVILSIPNVDEARFLSQESVKNLFVDDFGNDDTGEYINSSCFPHMYLITIIDFTQIMNTLIDIRNIYGISQVFVGSSTEINGIIYHIDDIIEFRDNNNNLLFIGNFNENTGTIEIDNMLFTKSAH